MVESGERLGLIHRFERGEPGAATLLLLHGTGGDESDLLSLGRALAPGAALLSPRGAVLEHGMPRFFRRLAPGVLDEQDLRERTLDLAAFIERAGDEYALDARRIYAVGYSNGANIAASLMLLRPDVLRGAVLFRAMRPFRDGPPAGSPTTNEPRAALITAGTHDAMTPPGDPESLARDLRESGVDVVLHHSRAGHELSPEDLRVAREWLDQRL